MPFLVTYKSILYLQDTPSPLKSILNGQKYIFLAQKIINFFTNNKCTLCLTNYVLWYYIHLVGINYAEHVQKHFKTWVVPISVKYTV